MYYNDVHIIYYVVIIILGAIIGKFANWAIYRLSEKKNILSLHFFKAQKQYKENYLVILSNIILYILILYKFGIQTTPITNLFTENTFLANSFIINIFIANLELIKYLILVPMLLIAFVIDYKLQIIPNRLTLTIFETGLIISFIYGLSNVAITINMLLGMVAGSTIFLLIILLSKLIFGKDSIGLGDVKLIGGLGLFFGLTNIVLICLMSFFLAAIISIILLITKRKKANENISFGPMIVIASIISILVPLNIILNILLKICTLGLYKNKVVT